MPQKQTNGKQLKAIAKTSRDEDLVLNKVQRNSKLQEFFATCHPGASLALLNELRSLGIPDVDLELQSSGVTFWTQFDLAQKACVYLRSAIRVLHLVSNEKLDLSRRPFDDIYDITITSQNWRDLIPVDTTFNVSASIRSNQDIRNSQFVSNRVRDAIKDQLRQSKQLKLNTQRPLRSSSYNKHNVQENQYSRNTQYQFQDINHNSVPEYVQDGLVDVPIFVTCFNNQIKIYRDMCGVSLHNRGYRGIIHKAQLNEVAASACLLLAWWDQHAQKDGVITDPLCGSGTFLLEAALMALNIPPNLKRVDWPFQKWPDYNQTKFEKLFQDAKEGINHDWKGFIQGNEIHSKALALAQDSIQRLSKLHNIDLRKGISLDNVDCKDWKPQYASDLIITNPPWGFRLTENQEIPENILPNQHYESSPNRVRYGWRSVFKEDLDEYVQGSWESLSKFLRSNSQNSDTYILCGNNRIQKVVLKKIIDKKAITIGGVDCRLIKYLKKSQYYNKNQNKQDLNSFDKGSNNISEGQYIQTQKFQNYSNQEEQSNSIIAYQQKQATRNLTQIEDLQQSRTKRNSNIITQESADELVLTKKDKQINKGKDTNQEASDYKEQDHQERQQVNESRVLDILEQLI